MKSEFAWLGYLHERLVVLGNSRLLRFVGHFAGWVEIYLIIKTGRWGPFYTQPGAATILFINPVLGRGCE